MEKAPNKGWRYLCACPECECHNWSTPLGNGLCMPCAWGRHRGKIKEDYRKTQEEKRIMMGGVRA